MLINPRPFALNYRRLLSKAGASLLMLSLVLALCSLLMSCACQPTVDPARLERLIQLPNRTLVDLGIVVNCTWRY